MQSGNYSTINWAGGNQWLKVEMDPTGGNSYTNMGESELLSVPFANYAATGGTTYSAGSGINVTGTVISNTAPDQVISLTGTGATSVTGTYPNFTINSTDNNTTYTPGTGIAINSNTISLTNTGVAPGIYGSSTSTSVITVDAQGRITSASSAGISGLMPSGTSGQTLRHNDSGWIANDFLYNNGTNIGIGTTSPSAMLHVYGGDVLIQEYPGQTSISLTQGTVVTDNVVSGTSRYVSSIGSTWLWGSGVTSTLNSDYHLVYYPSTRWDMTVLASNGNVGIGTLTPAQKLHVAGTIRTTAIENDQTNDLNINSNQSINSSANLHMWYTASTERMRITNVGNVGIGTSNPNYGLHLHNPGGAQPFMQFTTTTTGTTSNDGLVIGDYSAGEAIFWNWENQDMFFGTNAAEHMRITASGNVGIGTASPGARLEVAGQVKITGGSPAAGKVLTSDASEIGRAHV